MYIVHKFKKLYRQGQFSLKNYDLLAFLPQKEHKHSDKYHYLLHRLYVGRSMDKRKDSGSWINLSSVHLRNVMSTHRANVIIRFWIRQGVIECNEKAAKNKFCKGYRFTEAYRHEPMHLTPFVDKRFSSSLDRKKQQQYLKPNVEQLNQTFLLFNLQELKIDIDSALARIEDKFRRVRKRFGKYNKYITAVTALHNREYYFKRDSKGRRLHNNFVNLPKFSKKDVYLLTGEELVNIDIVNSQPLMLCILLMAHGITGIEDYVTACETGKLYESLADAAGIEIADRTKYKRRFFKRVLYGRNENACNSPEFKTFATLYPTVAAFVVAQKKHSHKELSVKLQRIESEIVLDRVIQGLAMEYNPADYFALTIHDSITTTRSNEADMRERMLAAFKPYGVTPKLKTETF